MLFGFKRTSVCPALLNRALLNRAGLRRQNGRTTIEIWHWKSQGIGNSPATVTVWESRLLLSCSKCVRLTGSTGGTPTSASAATVQCPPQYSTVPCGRLLCLSFSQSIFSLRVNCLLMCFSCLWGRPFLPSQFQMSQCSTCLRNTTTQTQQVMQREHWLEL